MSNPLTLDDSVIQGLGPCLSFGHGLDPRVYTQTIKGNIVNYELEKKKKVMWKKTMLRISI